MLELLASILLPVLFWTGFLTLYRARMAKRIAHLEAAAEISGRMIDGLNRVVTGRKGVVVMTTKEPERVERTVLEHYRQTADGKRVFDRVVDVTGSVDGFVYMEQELARRRALRLAHEFTDPSATCHRCGLTMKDLLIATEVPPCVALPQEPEEDVVHPSGSYPAIK